ncbi:hypothetical protein [Magnetospira sp. QH-2]|uniref:hypothetical protein n=1 Tax=Magnetospira sp. (strain QH-2) TaxID=1288970 RepID=UPI0003E8196A|nr:hypothetical protein [Magnetospira sp. QH-2]CCQ75279.1 conserved protein of unknown function [Magnetospira sp. QH-2]
MISYQTTPDLIARATTWFQDREAADELLARAREQSTARPSPARLQAYATGRLPWPQDDLERALGSHLPLRRAYMIMVKAASSHHLPRARAASSDTLPTREGDRVRLSLRESRAEPDQLFLIVEISDRVPEGPSTLIILDSEDNSTQVALPEPRNGVAQVILDRASEAVRLLADPRSEAFIR